MYPYTHKGSPSPAGYIHGGDGLGATRLPMFLRLPKLIQTRSKIKFPTCRSAKLASNTVHLRLAMPVHKSYRTPTNPLPGPKREREREERKIVKQKRNHTGRRMEWGGGMSEEIHPQAPAQEGKDIIYITTITHRPHTRASKFQLRTNHTATE